MPLEDAVNFFVHNRQRFMEKIQGGVAVIPAYASMQRSNDLASPFEQEANFWWLCGIEMPNWWLIIDGSRNKSWLVAPIVSTTTLSKDQMGDEARSMSGVDGVLSHDGAMQMLRELSKKHSIIRTLGEQPRSEYLDFFLNPALRRMYDALDRIFITVQDCRRELAQMRAVKQPEEIFRIKKAVNLIVAGFERVKSELADNKYEYEVEASLTYHFRRHGTRGHAYDPVVAAGINACNLQYATNDSKLKKRELLLLDIGTRTQGYAAGLARTYSQGEPTQRQIDIHKTLSSAHGRIIKLIKPGLAIDEYLREVDVIMKDALSSLGLLSDRNDIVSYRQYFPHAVSHGVGVDVHDSLGTSHFFQPGMVLAVEPGVYISEEGIGLRLKDAVLVTAAGNINLSKRLSTDL